MSPDPHVQKILDTRFPCATHAPIIGRMNCILHARAPQRGLELCPYPSRAVIKGETHELILTNEDAAPNKTVNAISYLGYFEVIEGGVMWVGDRVFVEGREIGELAGYDLTHFPNHMNIIIKITDPLYTGLEANLQLGASISFVFRGRPQEE